MIKSEALPAKPESAGLTFTFNNHHIITGFAKLIQLAQFDKRRL